MSARFGVLDAVRGMGALSVVLYHAWPVTSAACQNSSCNVQFGYLAVDMFFVLSGFVISYKYEPRLMQGMTLKEFMRARVVRLYPIFFICALLGAGPILWYALNGQGSRVRFIITFVTNIFLLPAPTFPVQPDPFPLVSPAWSLFFELFVANFTYGLLWRRLTTRVLCVIVAVSFGALVAVVVNVGSIDGGSLWRTFPIGFPRVLFGFYAGVLVHRIYRRRPPPPTAGSILLVLITLSFWPRFSGWYASLYEIGCLVAYPLLIYLGASARERLPRLGALLGEISYPLYLVHIPILLAIMAMRPVLGLVEGPLAASTFVVLSIFAAFLLSRFYDPPARQALSWGLGRLNRA